MPECLQGVRGVGESLRELAERERGRMSADGIVGAIAISLFGMLDICFLGGVFGGAALPELHSFEFRPAGCAAVEDRGVQVRKRHWILARWLGVS